jgi:nitrogen fixation protein NifQ
MHASGAYMSDESPRKAQVAGSASGTVTIELDGHDLTRLSAARKTELMSFAIDTRSVDAALFAALIAAREVRGDAFLLGLSHDQLAGLYRRHFSLDAPFPPLSVTIDSQEHASFVVALKALLLAHVPESVDAADADCLAAIIAHACLRPDHLWRDLGLTGRDDVTAMLERYFPALVARNTENLRWKKFLARELALSQGLEPRPAPGCPGCEDFGFCFGGGN